MPTTFQRGSTPSLPDLPQLVLDAMTSDVPVDPILLKRYQSLVGALLYCSTNTRPDVAYAVNVLCRAMSRPSPELMSAALRVLYYLHVHRKIGLRYVADQKALSGMSDSDWAVRHSVSGWLFMYSSAVVSWASKRQKSVALSSCEAEIMASSEAAKEAVYLQGFLTEMGFGSQFPLSLGCDNKAARDLAYNPEHHPRTKHIDRRHFYIRELVELGRIEVPYVATADNLADFFTKSLPSKQFFALRDIIMNVPASESSSACLARAKTV